MVERVNVGEKKCKLQERDAGIYECQIPTQPPQSYPINLNIIGWIIIIIKIKSLIKTKINHYRKKVQKIYQTFKYLNFVITVLKTNGMIMKTMIVMIVTKIFYYTPENYYTP